MRGSSCAYIFARPWCFWLVARLGMLPSAPVVMIEIELVILSENEDLYPCCRYHHQSFHALE